MTTLRDRYWITTLLALIGAGTWCYGRQLDSGLGLTGMSRDVTWGLYIGQFLFAEGIAASMAILTTTLSGVSIAIGGVIASMLFIVADMGQPSRVLYVLRYASPGSLMFWDMLALTGYLGLNVVLAAKLLESERKQAPPPGWLRDVRRLAMPWAVGMVTIGAFLYCGLPGRSFWLTALLAPRFMVSAIASGAALLVLLQIESDRIPRPPVLVRYAIALNLFFILLEVFTTLYSGIPEPALHLRAAAPWLGTAVMLGAASLLLDRRPALASAAALASVWFDKGLGLIIGGFVPSPLNAVTDYLPTASEILIAAGIWAAGALVARLLCTGGNSEALLVEQEVSHEHSHY